MNQVMRMTEDLLTFVRVLVEWVDIRRLDDAGAALDYASRLAEVARGVARTGEVRAGSCTEGLVGGVRDLRGEVNDEVNDYNWGTDEEHARSSPSMGRRGWRRWWGWRRRGGGQRRGCRRGSGRCR